MTIYLINKESKALLQTFENVIDFTENKITRQIDNNIGVLYCGLNEEFVDTLEQPSNET